MTYRKSRDLPPHEGESPRATPNPESPQESVRSREVERQLAVRGWQP